MTNIAIIGLGKLGSAMAALYASSGHKVVGVDIDDALIERLQAGAFRTDEPEVNDLLAQYTDRLTFTRLPAEAVHASEIVFVVVPTPSKADGTFDSSLVVTACQQIGAALYEKKAYTLIVVVSTLMPGQMDADVVPVLERTSGKRAGAGFGVCYSPEFIALGRVVAGLRKPDYVLIGANDAYRSTTILRDFYVSVLGNAFRGYFTNFANAELIKLATNAYLSLKIAYANALGQICEQLPHTHIDIVTNAIGLDHRIGKAYLRAGLPAGGVCLPRDLRAMMELEMPVMKNNSLFGAVVDANLDHITLMANQIASVTVNMKDCILFLGAGYSPTTRISEKAPSHEIAYQLLARGYTISEVSQYDDMQTSVDSASVIVLTLPLDEFQQLTFHDGQIVFDIWRVLHLATIPDGVSLWQFGAGVKVDPYKGAVHGDMVSLSVPIDEFDGGFDSE